LLYRLSDNVGGVKLFSTTLLHALEQERHFALVDGFAFSNRRLARNQCAKSAREMGHGSGIFNHPINSITRLLNRAITQLR
jgi:hypothetical protein